MTFTGRIRLYLITIAVLPPVILLAVIYHFTTGQARTQRQQETFAAMQRFDIFDQSIRAQTLASVEALIADKQFQRQTQALLSGRSNRLEFDPHARDLDFLEILDGDNRVRASYHRPGLIGETLQIPAADSLNVTNSLEYDRSGVHLAYTSTRSFDGRATVLTGRYLEAIDLARIAALMNAKVELYSDPDSIPIYAGMTPKVLYEQGESFVTVLLGDHNEGWYLTAMFDSVLQTNTTSSLLWSTVLVAILSTGLAIGLGMIITGRAKREIDNLVQASSRIAGGDFSTPVMAYEEGEFSQLADSLSEMMTRLRSAQAELAMSEKIAAWQQMGRRVAHEIKNPLTPISIGIDDLQRSYIEKQPDYARILKETTGTIKTEIQRMTKLLDQFVHFARMKAPELVMVDCGNLIEDIRSLYRAEIEAGRLSVDDEASPACARFDPDAIKQVLINMIKNGLEATPSALVRVRFGLHQNGLQIRVHDTGPGFSQERLADPFQPYMTTKEGGSGLGMVIAYRIVHDHGGTMELYNLEEGGAGVRIVLPA